MSRFAMNKEEKVVHKVFRSYGPEQLQCTGKNFGKGGGYRALGSAYQRRNYSEWIRWQGTGCDDPWNYQAPTEEEMTFYALVKGKRYPIPPDELLEGEPCEKCFPHRYETAHLNCPTCGQKTRYQRSLGKERMEVGVA